MADEHSSLSAITGTVKHLTYVNPENGYFVARVLLENNVEKTVTGTTPAIHVGEHIRASGKWGTSNWGPQFKASDISLSAPTALDGIEKFLASAIEGVGPGNAKKLVKAFGTEIFEIIESQPEKLSTVPGIGPKRIASILAAYQEQKARREVMVFLYKNGLTPSKAQVIHQKYGANSMAKLRENPYILCTDIGGIGFATADRVALKLGIQPDSDFRIRAGIAHVLNEAQGQGSCGLPVAAVLDEAGKLLGQDYPAITRCIDKALAEKSIVQDVSAGAECLFAPNLYNAEKFIGEFLLEHQSRVPAYPVSDIDQTILEAEVEIGIELAAQQRDAVRISALNQVAVITGGPGCGKTTITKVLIHVLNSAGLGNILLCAPTGKAAKRASESTGHPALTVHRMLEVGPNGRFKRGPGNPLDADVVIVDESSMLDVSLTASICRALPPRARLYLIGDVDQLPSVGPGRILSDIIESRALPTVRLDTIFRQAAGSAIIQNAHLINEGKMPRLGLEEGSDFRFVDFGKVPAAPEAAPQLVVDVVQELRKWKFNPIRDVQVLTPMRKGPLGVESLNLLLQQALNPHPAAELVARDIKWRTGDKVMQRRNNYEKNVFNGDIGFVHAINVEERALIVDFDGVQVLYKSSDLDELSLAYAFTVHKSQGSEFPAAVVLMTGAHYVMQRRNLLYTGVTRSKKLCVLMGEKRAIARAVDMAQLDERYSCLRKWLQKGVGRQSTEQLALEQA